MKVSLIVPVFNSANRLEKCIQSLINQTYKNIEFIFVDDESTDNSVDIIKKYMNMDNRIILIFQKNQGPNIARKNGIEHASGEYILFVDSDDWIGLETIEILVEKLKKYKVDIIKFRYIKEPSKEIMPNLFEKNDVLIRDNKSEIYDTLITTTLFNEVWNEIVKKEIVVSSISSRKINIGEDALLNYEIFSKAESILVTNDVLYHYFENPYGITKNLDNKKIIKNIVDIFEVYEEKFYYLNKWNLNENKYLKETANKLLKFIVGQLFKLYRINEMKDNELDDIYNIIFSNKTFKEYVSYIKVKDIKCKNPIKKIYMKLLLKKNINKMNKWRILIKKIYEIKYLLNV